MQTFVYKKRIGLAVILLFIVSAVLPMVLSLPGPLFAANNLVIFGSFATIIIYTAARLWEEFKSIIGKRSSPR